MDTTIGKRFGNDNRALLLSTTVAAVVVLLDFWFSSHWYPSWTRVALAAVALTIYISRCGADRGSLGLRATPLQPLSYWIRVTAILAAIMVVPIVGFALIAVAFHWTLQVPQLPPADLGPELVRMCVVAPIVEELIYRSALCSPATAAVGSTGAIIVSGLAFAGLHIVCGNPAPDNFFAGYLLAWAFMKGGSIVVPIALHSLGNALAVLVHVVAWYVA